MNKSVIWFGLILLALSTSSLRADEDNKTEVSKPCLILSGNDSHISEPAYKRILTLDKWAKVWQQHKGEESTEQYDYFYDPLGLPMVDFSKFMVIAIFDGNRSQAAGLFCNSVSDDGNTITIKFDKKTYATDSGFGEDENKAIKQKKENVYGFFVIPKSYQRLVLEQRIYGSKQLETASNLDANRAERPDSQWQQCIKFEAVKDKPNKR